MSKKYIADIIEIGTSATIAGNNILTTTSGYATTNYVDNAVAGLVDSAPTTLDTLNELATALGNDPNFATTVTNSIGLKWTQDNTKISNWDTAYGWGNHAAVGYLTSFTETDPIFSASPSASITSTNISNWNTSYGWGNHSGLYLPIGGGALTGPLAISESGNTLTIDPHAAGVDIHSTGNIAPHFQTNFTLYTGAIGSGTQRFRVDSSGNVTATGTLSASGYNNSNWDTAYGWGDHAAVGYLTSLPSHEHTYIRTVAGTTTADAAMPTTGYALQHFLAQGPSGNDGHTIGMTWTGTSAYGAQIWVDTDPNNIMAFRSRSSTGVWTNWNTLVHSGNVGSYAAPIGGSYGTDWYANAVYYDDWIRNHSNTNGLYWSTTGWHLHPYNSNDFTMRSGSSVESTIRFANSGNTTWGYIHNDANKTIGFLNDSRNWVSYTTAAGHHYATASSRAPVFYDSNDTTYYVDPNSSSTSARFYGNIDIYARSAAWAEGLRVRVPTVGSWGGIRWTRDRANYDGNWALGYKGAGDTTDDLVFWANNGGTERVKMRISKDSKVQIGSDGESPNLALVYDDNHANGDRWDTVIQLGKHQERWSGNSQYPTYVTANGYGMSIQSNSDGVIFGMEEYSTGNYRPVIAWGDDSSDSPFTFKFNNSNKFHFYYDGVGYAVGDWRAPIFRDSDNTSYYINPNGDSNLYGNINMDSGWLKLSKGHGDTRLQLLYDNGTASQNAQLLLWASEPGITYHGVGIGANISFSGQYYGRRTSALAHGVYMRMDANNGNFYFETTTGTPGGSGQQGGVRMQIDPSGNTYSFGSSRAPIFYDYNNTGYYVDPTSDSLISGTLNISGNTGGSSYGNQLVVGQSSKSLPYTLQDTNTRPIIYATGKYPVLTLNHTVTTNTNHGPTIQFTHNGGNSNSQWVAGTNGTGSQFQIGYSNTGLGNSNFNPHNGIAGYNGVTAFHIDDSSRIGIGHAGDWGGLGGGNPVANIHLKAPQTYYSYGSYHSTVIQSTQSGGGLNGSGLLVVNDNGNHSWGVVAEFRVNSTSDGDRPAISFTSGLYSGQNWTLGYAHNSGSNFRIKRDHGWVSQSWGTTLMEMDRNGNVTFTGDVVAYSDERLKKDIKTIEKPLDIIKQLRGVTYKLKENDKESIGLIAQEVEKVLPQVVLETEGDVDAEFAPKGVAYGNIVGVLIEAIKELSNKVEQLEAKINGAN